MHFTSHDKFVIFPWPPAFSWILYFHNDLCINVIDDLAFIIVENYFVSDGVGSYC